MFSLSICNSAILYKNSLMSFISLSVYLRFPLFSIFLHSSNVTIKHYHNPLISLLAVSCRTTHYK